MMFICWVLDVIIYVTKDNLFRIYYYSCENEMKITLRVWHRIHVPRVIVMMMKREEGKGGRGEEEGGRSSRRGRRGRQGQSGMGEHSQAYSGCSINDHCGTPSGLCPSPAFTFQMETEVRIS